MNVSGWFQSHEYIAIWLEGVALVLIFIWDRFDSAKQHGETLAQLRIAQQQIEASHNAERAWVMTELGWYETSKLRITTETSNSGSRGDNIDTTSVSVKLTCRNEGRSPAWIDKIYGHSQIMENVKKLTVVTPEEMQSFGIIGPLGPHKVAERNVVLTCPGHINQTQSLSIYVVIEYLDIFGNRRMTSLGYVTSVGGGIDRQEALPERNRNT
jgi:hypothetical protein